VEELNLALTKAREKKNLGWDKLNTGLFR
jgi:hypothetical protein